MRSHGADSGKAGLAIRTDELQKLGLDKPYTIEEFENTLLPSRTMA